MKWSPKKSFKVLMRHVNIPLAIVVPGALLLPGAAQAGNAIFDCVVFIKIHVAFIKSKVHTNA